MGYYVSSRGGIDLPDSAVEAVWVELVAAAADNRVDLCDAPEMADEFGTEGKIACVIAGAIGSDSPGESWERGSDATTVHLEVWGDGDVGEAMEVLAIVASGGGTGVINSHSDGDSKWRWRLEDGEVHDENGRVLYGDEVDSDAWIAQLRSPDSSTFDRVAVVPSESAAMAMVASWCRKDYHAHSAAVPGNYPPLDEDASDIETLAQWTAIRGSVHYLIARIGDCGQSGTTPTSDKEN